MAQTVGELIRGRGLEVVKVGTPVNQAVRLMVDRDYSQLPVVDERGRVVGLFTERRLAKAVMMGMGCDIVDMPVNQVMEEPGEIVHPDRSIFKVARLLADNYAVVVGLNGKPIGIVTDYDIAVFLSDWSHGIALVEDIEKRLRAYIERVFPTAQAREAALFKALGPSRDDPVKPAKAYHDLTLREHVQLIITKENWPCFEQYFQPKTVFTKFMNQAIPIRNQIAHFRGKLTQSDVAILEAARDFLAQCPKVPNDASPQ